MICEQVEEKPSKKPRKYVPQPQPQPHLPVHELYKNFPNTQYDIIYVDPPWSYSRSEWSPNNHYDTLHFDDLKRLPINQISHPHTVLFMWVVDCYVDKVPELLQAWNFKFRDVAFIWVKLTKKSKKMRMGLGPNTRKNAEQCWMAIRQETKCVPRPGGSHSINQVFSAPIRRHSQKPDEVRRFICDLFPTHTRKIELFGRKLADSQNFEGWDVW